MSIRDWLDANLSSGQKKWLGGVARRLRNSQPDLVSGCELPEKILIGTHHKTGSAWFDSIFKSVCHYHSLVYYKGRRANLPREFDIFMNEHSEFEFDSLPSPYRGIHVIRDPRDVIVSGCFYHQKSGEEWLHQPMDSFYGQTYQQKINSYTSLEDQILFEMEHVGARTIKAMTEWNYSRSFFCELKYEELIADTDLTLFYKVFLFLGFPGSAIPSLLAIAYNNSLFSGRVRKSLHVRSGDQQQWKKYFTQKHKQRFLALFGDALIALGYENDDNWNFFQSAHEA
jgi:hypothetical protein